MKLDDALNLITEVPDFPEPGVLFRDLSPLFADAAGFAAVTDALADTVDPGVELLAGVEARGFLLAAAVGYSRGLGVALIRKPGKLPRVAGRVDYALEYGTATVELPAGSRAARPACRGSRRRAGDRRHRRGHLQTAGRREGAGHRYLRGDGTRRARWSFRA